MDSPPNSAPRWALLADDLSGACDSAVAFAKAGFRTRLELGEADPQDLAELTAISTETRESSAEEAAQAVPAACARIKAAGLALLFKKIDSVLRGPVEAEIAATLAATEFDTAVVCPAFPSQGRQVRGGRLLVRGEDRGALPAGAGFELRDALTDADLDELACELLDRPQALPVGSGGLAAAYAGALGPSHGRIAGDPKPPRSSRLAAFWIGSENPSTVAQMQCLESSSAAHQLVRVDMYQPRTDVSALAAAIERQELGALVLSGGATARRILEGLEARAIEVRGEAIPGAPWGTIVSGPADGLTVITKSGGFGAPDAFVEIAELLAP